MSALALLVLATALAGRASGFVFASVLVDPFGDYSALQLSEWRDAEIPFRAGDRLLAIDGRPAQSGDARALDDALAVLAAAGASRVRLTFDRGEAVLPLRTIGSREIWWLYGFYALLACSFLWSGLAVWRIAPKRPAAWAYVATTTTAFAFLVTFFDYHVTRTLTPVFAAASLGNAVCLCGLALSFPSFPDWARRSRRVLGALFLLGSVGMLALFTCAALGIDARLLRLLVNVAVPSSLVVLAGSFLARYFARAPEKRRELRWLVFSLGAVPTWLGVAALVDQRFDVDWLHLTLPLVGLLVPGGIGLSLIKHDFLATGALLTRRLLMIPIGFAGLAMGGAAWAWTAEGVASRSGEISAAVLGLMTFFLTLITGWWGVTRLFFRSRALYQPMLDHLADRLALHHDAPTVRLELAAVTQQLFPECRVQVLERAQQAEPNTGRARWVVDEAARVLLVPLVSAGQALGGIVISARPSGALFTSDELALVETVSSLGALALHNAQTVARLEELRELEVNLSRADKRLSVDILAAEVAHELAYPLNYFRHFLRRLERGAGHAAEDVDIGQEEVARLERMLASVRKLQTPVPTLKQVQLDLVAQRAAVLLRGDFESREQVVELALASTMVRADADQLLQVLTNLLRNASQAAGRRGRLGVRALSDGLRVELVVWDTGPGVPEDARSRIFSPWFTTRPEGSGLGLAVTQRIVRSFGWTIDVERRDLTTCFVIRGPIQEGSSS